jgi:CelD/BcsL family acetyltransferase involved in cellulose biosynthesis
MQETIFQVVRGESFETKFKDAAFRSQWNDLSAACPWATSMQSLPFLEAWYGLYRERYEPVLALEFDAENKLRGLLPLAVELKSGKLVVGGDNLCEYGTWLAFPDNGDSFMPGALDAIEAEFPNAVLEFLYLAAGTPLQWLNESSRWKARSTSKPVRRPLQRLGDGAELRAGLEKKKTRTRLKQLERNGAIEFTQLTDPDELEAVFDQVQTFSDLRLSAVHAVAPTFDPAKKRFYLELLRAGLLHATLLKVGGEIASAHFNLYNRGQILLGLTALSPFFAKHSPSKFHISMLGIELVRQGIEVCDLTPGGNYKDQHANSYDEVHVLTIYFNRSDYVKSAVRRRAAAAAKKGLELANIDPKALLKRVGETKHKLKLATTESLLQKLAAKTHLVSEKPREMRIYTFDVEKIAALPNPNLMNHNCLADLLEYEPTNSWDLTPSDFHRTAVERLSQGDHVYTRVEEGVLVHCGWLKERQEESFIFEVNRHFTLDPDSAVMFDFFTHPQARGKGLYQSAMKQMLHDAGRIPNTRKVYISVLADNIASRRAIEKIGFEYQCSLHSQP